MRFNKPLALLVAALLVTMGVGGALAGTAQHDDHADANATDHEAGGPDENASDQAHAVHAVIEQYLNGELEADSLGAAVSDVAAADGEAEASDENESAENESDHEPPEQAEDDEADEERTDDDDERDEADEDRAEQADDADDQRADG